ncbi:Siderophore synthetase component, ligase [Minicystis rosea]|nr:Siderophore synthetase component, ligase [Minicystis rosea]
MTFIDLDEPRRDDLRPLDRTAYRAVNRAYIAKSIAELLHERLLEARERGEHGAARALEIRGDDPTVRYVFLAQKRRLDYWHVDAKSILRIAGDTSAPADDAHTFYLDLKKTIGIKPITLAKFIEETAQTLYADAFIKSRGRKSADALVESDYQGVERQMEGHPWVIMNKGRMGFDARAAREHTPEAGVPRRILWLGAHRSRAAFHAVAGIDEASFFDHELGPEVTAAFRQKLTAAGLDPKAYVFLPVHEWQWTNKIVVLFAADLAEGLLVPLGSTSDEYLPQQSIRTFFNATHPDRCYVKTALSILNTGQIRGLSQAKLKIAPRITALAKERFDGDAYLRARGLAMLGEIVTVTYRHPAFSEVEGAPYQYQEMLGALFRESALPRLAPGEKLMTMAALTYVDDDGVPLMGALARRAGISMEAWLRAFMDAYLKPLLHFFYRHQAYFVAHGENTILVMEGHVPKRIVLKDFVEEIQFSKAVRAALAEDLRPIFYEIDDHLIPLFILTDVFDGFFRYLSDILQTHLAFAEDRFWEIVAETVYAYQDEFPDLRAEFDEHDLFVPEFPRFCINKYRLVYFGYEETANNTLDTDPKFTGTLDNPIAPYRRR